MKNFQKSPFRFLAFSCPFSWISQGKVVSLQQNHTAMPDLNSELDFFIRNQEWFYQLFPDRWVAIKDHQVVALGDTLEELLGDAKARGHELGTFQAQLCGRDASCYTAHIHPVVF